MNKIISLFLIFNILLFTNTPVFAIEKPIKKPHTGVFNMAIKKGRLSEVKQYIEAGANPNAVIWKTPVIITAIDSKQNEMLDLLLENGANPNPTNALLPPLYYAVVKRNIYAVEKLIQAGSNQDKTYVGITAEQLAINKGYTEIIEIFSKYDKQGHLIKQSSTNLNNAIDLLQDTILGSTFYDYIKGRNLTGQPIKVSYHDLSKFGKRYNETDYLALTRINEGRICIYISNHLKNSSPEALAVLIASTTIHQDSKDSINEEIYSATLQAALWSSFTQQNPNLRLEQTNLVNTLNTYADYWEINNYDVNAFKSVIKENKAYSSLPQSSPGFSNEDLGLIKDPSLMKKTVDSVANYCKEHDVATKLKTSCEVIALLGLVALEAIAIYYGTQAQTPMTVYTPMPSAQRLPMVTPNYKYNNTIINGQIHRQPTIQSYTIRSFY